MVELQPIHSSIWDCYEDCVCSICKAFDINPIYMFSEAWNFTLLPEPNHLEEWMEKQKQAKKELLKEYSGLELTTYFNKNIEELKEFCKKNVPVIIGADLYNLPWSDYYQKIHAPHACIIIDYDGAKKRFELVDPTIMKKDIYLDEESIKYINVYETVDKIVPTKKVDYLERLKASLLSFNHYATQENAFQDMALYAKEIVNQISSQRILEIYPLNPLDSEPLLHILFISRNRLTYAQWLKYVGEQQLGEPIIEISKKMQAVGLKWQNLRMKIMRGLYQNTLLKLRNEVEEYILDLSQIECSLYEELSQYINQYKVNSLKLDEKEKGIDKVYVALDLKKYFNHQAFYKEGFPYCSDGFDGEGYFYTGNHLKASINDHIICKGQNIAIVPQNYTEISVTASASKGHYLENLKLIFEDQSVEKISIGFSDWWEVTPLFDEKIVWTGPCVKVENHQMTVKGIGHVFLNTYKIKTRKKVKEIILPDNPNLHIFKLGFLKERRILEPLGSIISKEKMQGEEVEYWDQWENKIVSIIEKDRKNIIHTNGENINKVAITFDDAPDAITTPQILKILKEHRVKATFSVIGCYFEECGDLLKAMMEEGHQIINHTWLHKHLSQCKKEEIQDELLKTEEAIFNITGKRPLFMRPPYGDFDNAVQEVIGELGLNMVLWSYNTFDWVATQKEDILNDMMKNMRQGEIILMHSYENKQPTIDALPDLIEAIKNKGMQIVTVSELLGIEAYKK